MRPSERLFNSVAGLSVMSWGVMGLLRMHTHEEPSVVRVCIAALDFCVGGLFIARAPLRYHAGTPQLLLAMGSFIGGGLAFVQAPPPQDWPLPIALLFALGSAVAILALLYLGRAFAVLPAVRFVVRRGPYRLVRHPAYGGELLMVGACCLAGAGWIALLLFLLNLALLVLRIRIEEDVMLRLVDYGTYSSHTRYRLLPGLW